MASSTEQGSGDSVESQLSSPGGNVISAPKFGYVVPNRVFVGGISSHTTEPELANLFSKYGNVIGTKIISDRAGVSKGYGFVTFETEEEAKRLQVEDEPILLRDRRLNIAPAIKKQSYPRPYDTVPMMPGASVPMTASPLYRQTSVPFYQNGMAFYAPTAVPSQQPTQPLNPMQSSVESPPGYPPGAFGGLAQNGSPPGFAFSYASQSQLFYPPPYSYHLALDGGYQPGSDAAMTNSVCLPANGNEAAGSLLYPPPPYVIIQQPPPGAQPNLFYDPQNGAASVSPTGQEQAVSAPPLFYASPRGFEPAPLFFAETSAPTTLPNVGEPSQENHEASLGVPNQMANPRSFANQELHVLMPHDSQSPPASRGRGRGRGLRGGSLRGSSNRRPSHHYDVKHDYSAMNNNNNENAHDRNNPDRPLNNVQSRPSKFHPTSPQSYKNPVTYRSSRPPLYPSHSNSTPNQNMTFAQVPQYPFVPGIRTQYLVQPMMSPHFQSPRRGGFTRPRTNGRGGKPAKMNGWYRETGESVTDEGPGVEFITPPITPRSPTNVSEDHLAQPMQNLKL